MLPLQRQGYSAVQVDACLRASTGYYGCRFELLDVAGNVVGNFDVAPPGAPGSSLEPGTVTAATVQVDGERKLTGSLDLTMLPDPRLRDVPFQYAIRPVFRAGPMPDGGMVEFNCGTYPWVVPERDICPGIEEWKVTLADRLIDMDSSGPGIDGFHVYTGELQTDSIQYLVQLAGLQDLSGIHHNNTMAFPAPRSWGLTRPMPGWGYMLMPAWQQGWGNFYYQSPTDSVNEATIISFGGDPTQTRTTTLLDIATELHAGIGYNVPWMNLEGVYRAQPANDWTKGGPVTVFGTAADGITVSPMHTTNDLSKFCNRVTSWSESSGAALFFVQLDANNVVPGHPLSQARIRRYADTFITNSTADTQIKAEQQCRKALLDGLATYQRMTWTTLFYPVEPFDLVGVWIAGDAEFGDLQLFEERKYTWDLFAGTMAHEAARAFVVA